MSIWFYVYAANNQQSITDATISPDFFNYGEGNYYVDVGLYNNFWVSAPNYQTVYSNIDYSAIQWYDEGHLTVALSYTGGWPQTY